MNAMHELREMLCVELDEIAGKGELSAGDLDTIHKLTDTIKNIDKIEKLDSGYSRDGGWMAEGTYGYGRGNSYGNGRRMSRGRYSYDTEAESLMNKMREMIDGGSLSSSEKATLRKAMEMLK